MGNNIENLKHEINKNQNIILGLYTDLIVCYEETRQLYQSVLQDYEDSNSEEVLPIKCSGLYCTNKSATVTRWSLFDLNGVMFYQSDRYPVNKTATIDLREQHRETGILFKLSATVTGKDSTSDIILEYEPNAEFVKFEVGGSAFHTWINYLGTAPAPIVTNNTTETDITTELE